MNQLEPVTRRKTRPLASWPRFWWVNLLFAVATLVTTTLFGSALVTSFRSGMPLDPDLILPAYTRFVHGDVALLTGLQFSVPLFLFLLAHEMGHYLQCQRWRVDATLPYFVPSPSLLGTFGAFMRITSPILTRCSLFDIGIGGPLAGFAALVPFLVLGVKMSHPMRAGMPPGPFVFSAPLAVRLLEVLFFPAVPSSQIVLHPMAMAAWAGLLSTAINLLPVGQLDGGHIVYATLGPRLHRTISTALIGVLLILGFWYWTWWAWAVFMFFFGRHHPLVHDPEPVTRGRWVLVAVVCVLFLLSFSVIPVRVGF